MDLLRLPVLGAFLGWKHARSLLQGTLLAVAVLILLDGWFGPELAPRNLAGILPWVHWRGFVVLSLLVVGNLFCMACPFMLPRRLAKRILPADRSWPAALQSKWLAVVLLLAFFWSYEAFSLWESPWLTAWVAGAYFAGAFVVDGFFKGASFCRYVCPIGQFHFVNGMVSPFEVRVRDPKRCTQCTTKDCIRGRYEPALVQLQPPGMRLAEASSGQALGRVGLVQRGCEMALYLPRKEGNLDCTFCMECIQACPHDNVGIIARTPLRELALDRVRAGVGRIQVRPDWAALALILVYAAFLNALGMVAPVYRFQAGIAALFGTESRTVVYGVFFLLGLVILPAALTWGVGWASQRLSGHAGTPLTEVTRYAWGLIPVGMGMWTAHYLYHLLIGGATLVPVVQEALLDLGIRVGSPQWGAGALVPEGWLIPLKVLPLQVGWILSLMALWRIALAHNPTRQRALRGFLPWALLAWGLGVGGLWLLFQPMEMRGTFLAPGL
jgi:polyferredoxin